MLYVDLGGAASGARHIRLREDVSAPTAATLQPALLSLLHAPTPIRIDLSAVANIDCIGLQILLLLEREAGRRGVPLRFSDPASPVRALAGALGLDARLGLAEVAA